MNKTEKLILDNFSLEEKDLLLLDKLCEQDFINDEKIFEIVSNLINFRLDFDSIVAYLAYELNYSFDENIDSDILKIYNTLCANFKISEGMSKQEQAEILRKMFIALSTDIRVIVIRLYIMLYDISKYTMPLSKEQHQNLLDIREIFAPLAERLGLNSLKSNLEDYCLKYLDPKIYENLSSSVMLQKDENGQNKDYPVDILSSTTTMEVGIDISNRLNAELVEVMGRVIVLFRRNKENPKIKI